MVDMVDRISWPEVFPAKVIAIQAIPKTALNPSCNRYQIAFGADPLASTMWVLGRYLRKFA